jgi:hypothetical protein
MQPCVIELQERWDLKSHVRILRLIEPKRVVDRCRGRYDAYFQIRIGLSVRLHDNHLKLSWPNEQLRRLARWVTQEGDFSKGQELKEQLHFLVRL